MIQKAVITQHASHLWHVFYHNDRVEREAFILSVRRTLRDVHYDTMVGCGLSGALVVPMLARRFRKNWVIVRKKDEQRHSPYYAEGTLGQRWIFVDDFVASGKTHGWVQSVIAKWCEEHRINFETTEVGWLEYGDMIFCGQKERQ